LKKQKNAKTQKPTRQQARANPEYLARHKEVPEKTPIRLDTNFI